MGNGTASKLEAGQVGELGAAIMQQLAHIEGLGETYEGWIKNKAALKKALQGVLVPPPQEAAILAPFKNDKTKNGWTLLEDTPPIGQSFVPDFVSFLQSGESSINGDVMRMRAKKLNANLGQRDLEWLEANQHLIPESERGHYLVATGTVWQDSDGHRHVPYLRWHDDWWVLSFLWLSLDCFDFARLVRSRE